MSWAARRPRAAAVAFAAAGTAVLGWLIHRAGPALLWSALERVPRWIAIPLAIEGFRIAVEAWGTRRLYAQPVPFSALLRTGLIGYSVSALAPAGRATGEGVKAVLLSRYSPLSDTAAAATTVQSASLGAVALLSAVCTSVALGTSRVLA